MKMRFMYAVIALLLLGVEVCIALFVHDNFVRPYLGDVLVVMLIHSAVRVGFLLQTGKEHSKAPKRRRWLPLYVFLFACLTELAQYFHLLDLFGLAHIRWLRIVIGGTFDWADIICYSLGCAVMAMIECAACRGGQWAARRKQLP